VKIWTPEEKDDTNTQRMAWLLFLEEMKAFTAKAGIEDYPLERAASSYEHALNIARIVRKSETA